MNKKILVAVALCTLFALVPMQLRASGTGGSSQQSSPKSDTSGSPASPGSGITNGTLPMEATILAYKVLSAYATKMADAINNKVTNQVVIIGTSNDIAAIIQLRIVLGQADILKRRLADLTRELTAEQRHYQPKFGAAPFIAGPSDVATLIQTLGSITAVNQALSSSEAALNDATLISLLADKIKAKVFIPSVFPPNLFPSNLMKNNLSETYIGEALNDLESQRMKAVEAALAAQSSKNKDPGINTCVNLIWAASAAVDAFETSLFAGQGYSL